MPFRKITAVYSANHTKHNTSKIHGQNAGLFGVKPGSLRAVRNSG
jgi:hypothetical protein